LSRAVTIDKVADETVLPSFRQVLINGMEIPPPMADGLKGCPQPCWCQILQPDARRRS
jgi:hypothetical protein